MTTDNAGYPIIAGNSVSAGGDFDIRYRSYYTDTSTLRWNAVATTWDGAAGGEDTAAGVVVDNTNNCAYVAGTTESASGDDDLAILKVLDIGGGGSFAGDLIWAQTFAAAPGGDETAAAVALDGSGNIHGTGGSQRADGSLDVLTVKYEPNGTRVWAKRYDNGGGRFDRGHAIAVRGSNVFVTGTSQRPGRGDDIVLIKYTLGGARQWVRHYDDPLHRSEVVSAMTLTSNSVYLCGSAKFTASQPGDALLLKYGYDGKKKWERFTAGSGGGNDSWTDVAGDNKAQVHVTGYCTRLGSGEDIVTRLYDSSGSRLWQRILKTGSMDVGTALAVDSSRRTYVCGWRTAGGDQDAVVIKYGTGGATLWKTTYPDPALYPGETDIGDDWANDVAVAGPNVYAVGRQTINHSGTVDSDFLTLAIWR